MILYLHGFRSSPLSTKAQQLRRHMEGLRRGEDFVCPQLPVSPFAAIELVEEVIRTTEQPIVLVGSSLGGYYATWLMECHWQRIHRVMLVNPAVTANVDLEGFVGPQRNWHTGETFEFTRRHVAELKALEVPLVRHQEKYWLLVETGDEVLDYRFAVTKYGDARKTVLEGGDHSFTRWADYLDEISGLDTL